MSVKELQVFSIAPPNIEEEDTLNWEPPKLVSEETAKATFK